MPFVKLDTTILDSSLWISRDDREIFITALLLARPYELKTPAPQIEIRSLKETGFIVPPGWYGLVECSGSAIARRAILEFEQTLIALEKLGSVDLESRSTDFDGRRMVRVLGGFIVLKFMDYRDKDSSNADRQNRFRQRQKERMRVNSVSTNNVDITALHNVTSNHADADAEADAEKEKKATRGKKITFKTHLENCRKAGTKAIPENHAVFAYAKQAELPDDFMALAYRRFRDRYLNDDPAKVYNDWPAAFRNAVKDNWFKLWRVDDRGWQLTTTGQQAQKAYADQMKGQPAQPPEARP